MKLQSEDEKIHQIPARLIQTAHFVDHKHTHPFREMDFMSVEEITLSFEVPTAVAVKTTV
jgi:hypothetical protein